MDLITQQKPILKSVSFNQASGAGKITIAGKLLVIQGVDDPVIEIFNAVQLKMQTAILNDQGKELINFTPLFPIYNESKDEMSYELVPTKPSGVDVEKFLPDADKTLEIFYKKLFIASFCQFLDDENDVCNYNGYSLYKECMLRIEAEKDDPKKRSYDIRTIRMLLENFIYFLGLPLPKSKEECERQAARLSLEFIAASGMKNINFLHDPKKVRKLVEA